MRILFLTDNFPPETNAPATRTSEHAQVWRDQGHQITILTGVPNFPAGKVFAGYRNRWFQRETWRGLNVIRVWTFIAPNRGFLWRTLDQLSFMFAAVLGSFRAGKVDLVVATSPQFFTAMAGWCVAKLRGIPFVFEVRDLWPETIAAVGALRHRWLLRLLERWARFLYRQADLVIPVTEPFRRRLIKLGVPEERIRVVTNGFTLDTGICPSSDVHWRNQLGIAPHQTLVGYVGTIGMCQGLEALLEAAMLTRENERIRYLLMGNGAERNKVQDIVKQRGLCNVTLLPPGSREEALQVLSELDVSLILLRSSPVFETVIPSKLFEAMALGKPVVAAARGEAARLITEHDCGWTVPPEDAKALAEALQHLPTQPEELKRRGHAGQTAVREFYDRRELALHMLEALVACTVEQPRNTASVSGVTSTRQRPARAA